MATIRIQSSAGRYDVHCARGALAQARSLIARVGDSTGLYVLSSPRVWKFWGREITRRLRVGRDRVVLFDDRESRKRLATIEVIARKLTRAGADRHCTLVAVGGGVVGDVAGFAAATYLRGVRIVHVPTTLVAQVDSSIGGKTGVDLPEGKNLVGAFHPPKLVIVDPELLRTLPQREYRSGLYEVVKYGIIADAKLFAFLEDHVDALLRRDAAALDWIIPRCIAIKARVVNADERESGLRKILNYGHTLGHALEAATQYKRFLHGEAVGLGMIAAAALAVQSGHLNPRDCYRILRLIWRIGPVPDVPSIAPDKLLRLIAGDKKSRGGEVGWVLPDEIGRAEWDVRIPNALVRNKIELSSRVMEEFTKANGEPLIGFIQPSTRRTTSIPGKHASR
ncbi:MAG TPA: 3-dehydroquinate synthase [Candidatus Acidoferrales bacterium]|nr:3-dehydroquinate synthase [Candidatus Acidoferrales bacterium]